MNDEAAGWELIYEGCGCWRRVSPDGYVWEDGRCPRHDEEREERARRESRELFAELMAQHAERRRPGL